MTCLTNPIEKIKKPPAYSEKEEGGYSSEDDEKLFDAIEKSRDLICENQP